MTQEEILQYNKRCVELVHWNKTHPKIKDWHIYITPIGRVSYDKMLFHSDWNWIMEVVEAIEKLIFNVRITISCVTIENAFDNDSNLSPIYKFHSIQGEFESKKEAVVEAINQFLIWYEKK